MITSPLPQLCRLARTLILWPIDTAAAAVYHYGLTTIENLLTTTEAFDNLAQAATNTMRSYTTDDYQRAAEVIKRTEPIRIEPFPDYATTDDGFVLGKPSTRDWEAEAFLVDAQGNRIQGHKFVDDGDYCYDDGIWTEDDGYAQ